MELAYGIQPFWFWNGEMKEEEIIRQIEEMHNQNISGFIIHPRQGMALPYLSQVYFQRVKLAVETAKRLNMEVWLYDEYPYPSGVSGGEVLALHPEYECKELKLTDLLATGGESLIADVPWGTLLYAKAFPCGSEGEDWNRGIDLQEYFGVAYEQEIFQFSGLTRYNKKRFFTGGQCLRLHWQVPEGQYRILIVVERGMRDFKYFGSYIDTMNPKAISCYLETTHEIYKREVGAEFGKTIKGIFTDEITAFPPEQPWSPCLPNVIKEQSGIDILQWLPAVMGIDMGPETNAIRYAYWNGATTAFMESYDKPVYQWCEDNHLLLIGEKPIMRAEELQYFHIPGFEVGHQKVGEHPNLVPGKYRANGKLAASAAHFYKKPGALCEAFHSIGWGLTLQDMKWTLDWISQQGIPWFIVHGYFYTTDGLQKHDAPPSAFFQMPWWQHMNQLSNYANQLSEIQLKKRNVRTLVLDPVASIWSETEERKALLKDGFHEVQMALLEHQLDYYIIDPNLLKTAMIKTNDRTVTIEINGEAYDTLILSPMCMLEPECSDFIKNYYEVGGLLCFIGEIPYVDTKNRYLWTQNIPKSQLLFFEKGEELAIKLKESGRGYEINPVDGKGRSDFLSTEFIEEDGSLSYFFTNLREEKRKFEFVRNGKKLILYFKPLESKWVKEEELGSSNQEKNVLLLDLQQSCCLSYSDLNALRLSNWIITTEDGRQFQAESMPLIEQLEKGGASLLVETKKNFGCVKELIMPEADYIYQTEFYWNSTVPMEQDIYLVMEPGTISGEWKIEINQKQVLDLQWENRKIYSPTNLCCQVSSYLRMGRNQVKIIVHGKESFHGVRNPVYLCGPFGVDIAQEVLSITDLPKQGFITDLLNNKTPFYAGKLYGELQIEATGQEEIITLKNIEFQDTLSLSLNGTDLGTCICKPYEFQIQKGVLKQGVNYLKMEIATTLIGLFEGQYFDREKLCYESYQGEEQIIDDYATILYK